jgi:hypothetical protein
MSKIADETIEKRIAIAMDYLFQNEKTYPI